MMEQMIRRRVPVSLQTLLINITPGKEELRGWAEEEHEPVTGERISLPFQTASEALLSPAGTDRVTSRPCGLCLSKPSCYTCPRCNIPYCGLHCYRGPAHSACSEEFYKECVSEELKCSDVTGDEGRAHMQEILLRLRSSAAGGGGLENVLEGLEDDSREDVTDQDVEALELLTRLAELQANGKEEQCKEVQEILQKLKNVEEGGHSEEEDETLACKLTGVNIDSLTEDELWDLLPSQDKERFEDLVMGGGISGLVPLWRPWWERHEQTSKTFIEELRSDKGEVRASEQKEGQSFAAEDANHETQMNIPKPVQTGQCPSQVRQGLKKQNKKSKTKGSPNSAPLISNEIPPLHKLSSNHSPLVQFSMVNTLYGYAFSLCLFNGDISESEQMLDFCRTVLEISESLGSSRVFSSLPEALEGAAIAVSVSGHSDRDNSDAQFRALQAVAHILTGQSKDDPTGYSLSALTELQMAFKKARASVSKEEEQWKRRFFLAGKKCEFFQSWVKENTETVKSLARQAWREYNWKQTERKTLERERKGVEEGWKKGRGKMLIEEI